MPCTTRHACVSHHSCVQIFTHTRERERERERQIQVFHPQRPDSKTHLIVLRGRDDRGAVRGDVDVVDGVLVVAEDLGAAHRPDHVVHQLHPGGTSGSSSPRQRGEEKKGMNLLCRGKIQGRPL